MEVVVVVVVVPLELSLLSEEGQMRQLLDELAEKALPLAIPNVHRLVDDFGQVLCNYYRGLNNCLYYFGGFHIIIIV